ncbi:DUF2062 domain-containing protein [Desulfosarcina variabilis]|uniref:DUF2062 domain-containing protein n=1 Tax=Desulfosarcina variabilis TaxID=2300 RepID=UPI003AFA9456
MNIPGSAFLKKLYQRFTRIRGNPREIAPGFALGLFISFSPTMGGSNRDCRVFCVHVQTEQDYRHQRKTLKKRYARKESSNARGPEYGLWTTESVFADSGYCL